MGTIVSIYPASSKQSYSKNHAFYSVFDLKVQARALLSLIDSLSQKSGVCKASTKYLSEYLGMSEQTVSRNLKRLEDLKLISRSSIYNEKRRGSKRIIKPVYMEVDFWVEKIENYLSPAKKIAKQASEKITKPIKKVASKTATMTKEVAMDVLSSLNKMQQKRKEYTPKTALAHVEKTYKHLHGEYNEGYLMPLTGKEQGFLKAIIGKSSVPKIEKTFTTLFINWHEVTTALKDMGIIKFAPDKVSLGLIASNWADINLVIEELELEKDKPTPNPVVVTDSSKTKQDKVSENEAKLKELGLA
jgi:DNA-binding Lrp family transcriptional regulator